LPLGLFLDAATGKIKGLAQKRTPAAEYTVTVVNASGDTIKTTLTIEILPSVLDVGVYQALLPDPNADVTQPIKGGTEREDLLPIRVRPVLQEPYTGALILSCTISSSVNLRDIGLSFDERLCVLGGNPNRSDTLNNIIIAKMISGDTFAVTPFTLRIKPKLVDIHRC